MDIPVRRTKIVATLGPASSSPQVIRQLVHAGVDVARLNFSHGTHEDHAKTIATLRQISRELDRPVTILQDLQGPKVRVGRLPDEQMTLVPGQIVTLVPESQYTGQPNTIPIDYAYAAEEAKPGTQVLLADGLFELEVVEIDKAALKCRVVEGGALKSRKGVNFPGLNLRLPSLTDKDKLDLEFGLAQDVDWISLSFVRTAQDVRTLKEILASKKADKPVIAKIEKPQAIANLEAILDEVDGVMVARGDLGVEMHPEQVPMLQKRIIELCNRRGLPVITATQMLESMIHEPTPTRAEASDVANAIIDGTDAVMLSGESAVGEFPVKAVEMMVRIAREVESRIEFKSYPPAGQSATDAIAEAAHVIGKIIDLKCIAVLTTSGYTARFVAAERPKALVAALTCDAAVYHRLNLLWGIRPLLVKDRPENFEGLVRLAEATVRERGLAKAGEKILVMGGVPAGCAKGTNFVKVHAVG